MSTNNLFPPDQRFGVCPPSGMCEAHLEHWYAERNRRFNPITGNRWPGHPGSPFIPVGRDLNRVREERRREWDEKASDRMQLAEEICLSGRSPQCHGERRPEQDRPPQAPRPSGSASGIHSRH